MRLRRRQSWQLSKLVYTYIDKLVHLDITEPQLSFLLTPQSNTMAEWAHYSLPDTEWSQMLASIGGLPPLFKSTDTPSDIPSRRVEINAYGRKAVESADSATCELIFSLSPYTFLLFGVTWVFSN